MRFTLDVTVVSACEPPQGVKSGFGHGFLSGGAKVSGSPKIFQQALDLLRERLVNVHRP